MNHLRRSLTLSDVGHRFLAKYRALFAADPAHGNTVRLEAIDTTSSFKLMSAAEVALVKSAVII